MKFIKSLPTYLLGIIYILASGAYFGMMIAHINPPSTPGMLGDLSVILMSSGFMTVVKVFEIVLGFGILVPKTRRLALVLIAPISLNVFLIDTLVGQMIGAGILLVVLNITALYQHKEAYRGMVE